MATPTHDTNATSTLFAHQHILQQLGIPDGPLSPVFDRTARLVSRLLHAPVALVTLLATDRQHFVGQAGLGEPWASQRETPFSHSFCQYVVADRAPLVVVDARSSPRLRDNLAIADLGVIAYAGVPLTTPEGEVLGALCAIDQTPRVWTDDDIDTLRDLAAFVMIEIERHRMVLAREAAEAQLRLRNRALEATTTGILITDPHQPDNPIIYCNPAFTQLTGYAEHEALGRNCRFLQGPETDPAARYTMHAAVAAGESCRVTLRNYRKDGTPFWNDMKFAPVRDGTGRLTHFVGVQHDITALVTSEAALARSELRFQAFMNHGPAAAWITDANGVMRYHNAPYLHMFRLSTDVLVGKNIFELYDAPIAQQFLDNIRMVAASGEVLEVIEPAPRQDGTLGEFLVYKFPLRLPGEPPLVGGVALDVTERRRAEAEQREFERHLLETQKLESLGVLAGGIAHDFNNLLVAMLGNAELALIDLDDDHPARASVMQIGVASRRAAELTTQMLAYSGRGRFTVAPLDLNELIHELTVLLHVSIPKQIELRVDPAPHLPLVEADASQIRQVVMNLVINAADAMEGRTGAVTITTRHQTFGASGSPGVPKIPAGSYVRLEVADSGAGMDAETQVRMFDPFFTTKFTGRGLGLAAVHGIVQAHGGLIRVQSAIGVGTTVTVLLPALPGATAESEQNHVAHGAAGESETTSAATILVIDDEAGVRSVTARMLERQGYIVLGATDGLDGLAMLEAHNGAIGCVLLDMTMPHLSGEETFHAIQERQPALPVVVMSGYSEDDVRARFGAAAPVGCLRKPFTPEELWRAVQDALSQRRSLHEVPLW